jgi:signal transduction histidine kinase
MTRKNRILASAVLLGLALAAGGARADGSEQAAKARAMLDRAVAAVKADEQAALESFTKGTNGFAEGDLYPFCARARSGWVVAHPSRLGENLATVSDVNGKLFGKEILNTAVEGTVKEIHYMWPKPGHKTPTQKDTYYTKVGRLVCGVGYYP